MESLNEGEVDAQRMMREQDEVEQARREDHAAQEAKINEAAVGAKKTRIEKMLEEARRDNHAEQEELINAAAVAAPAGQMTLQQAREHLVTALPGRSLVVHADVWFHAHYAEGERGQRTTEFRVCVFRSKPFGLEVDSSNPGADLSALVAEAIARPRALEDRPEQVVGGDPEPTANADAPSGP